MTAPFGSSVFVNCPFDQHYMPILRAVLFAIIDLKFEPRIATERLDSAEPRIQKLYTLIRQSRLAIHDLSRIKARKKGEMFRLNMPFELGLDVGCRAYGTAQHKSKRCLILETHRFRFQKALSDIAHSDIRAHGDKPQRALKAVHDWLMQHTRRKAHGPAALWARFQDFNAQLYDDLRRDGYSAKDVRDLSLREFVRRAKRWSRAH